MRKVYGNTIWVQCCLCMPNMQVNFGLGAEQFISSFFEKFFEQEYIHLHEMTNKDTVFPYLTLDQSDNDDDTIRLIRTYKCVYDAVALDI